MDDSNEQAYKEWISGVFGRGADKYSQFGPQFFTYFGQKLVDHARIHAGATILDIACGRGASLFPASERAGVTGRVVGIDLSAGMVAITGAEIERRQLKTAEIIQMDAEQLLFDDGTFDTVLCGLAMFFFPNIDQVLSEIIRVLKPQGTLVISTFGEEDPRWDSFGELISSYRDKLTWAPETERQRLNKREDIIRIFDGAGFGDIEIFSEERNFYFQDLELWWETLWSHGFRGFLERLDEADLATFKEEAFDLARGLMDEEGIPETFNMLITKARVGSTA